VAHGLQQVLRGTLFDDLCLYASRTHPIPHISYHSQIMGDHQQPIPVVHARDLAGQGICRLRRYIQRECWFIRNQQTAGAARCAMGR